MARIGGSLWHDWLHLQPTTLFSDGCSFSPHSFFHEGRGSRDLRALCADEDRSLLRILLEVAEVGSVSGQPDFAPGCATSLRCSSKFDSISDRC